LMGMLQFRIRHNLQDDSCLGRGDCFYDGSDRSGLRFGGVALGPSGTLAGL
jgi:hypothetical protein